MPPDRRPLRPLRKDAERNRQRVIQAARELFASRGLEATLNDVAHHAGVGVGTVYRRFPTKEELVEAIFENGVDQITALAESALREKDSWRGFVLFVERFCEVTATDRGLREAVFSKAYGGDRVEASRLRLTPPISKLVERARNDGHLRPEVSPTDIPFLGLVAGTVSEYAGHIEPELWRRYVSIFLDGLRRLRGRECLTVNALEDRQLDAAMRTWYPAGSS
ncbi:TetR/AcrR family transcriptional regulator [Mycobacterium sp. WUMAC-067]|uniref:TetR/AcrR family transcriptional regulator n=1 Tax=unclassified Mycobacterium TaxID=2642494 RepID=UPI001CD9935C|nr:MULTISPECIES: TetR/AcrR family transcriptional regulator [unclassified Mycobacterium]MCA2245822.1 TetR/AcrR family transcriptional regulator [Mycobacterium sp. WUMAC-067]MCA2317617.1 TetR/AcrR family transcriptional regulator [Mycobacterium sp. WUMAC-025]